MSAFERPADQARDPFGSGSSGPSPVTSGPMAVPEKSYMPHGVSGGATASPRGFAAPDPRVANGVQPDVAGIHAQLQNPALDATTRDRLMAQAQLASRFQIVADNVPPEQRLPNQLSQAEYAQMAAMYSDVRLGTSDLGFDVAGMQKDGLTQDQIGAFYGGAMEDMADILQTPSGRQLIQMLAYQPKDHKTRLGPSLFQGTTMGNPAGANEAADVQANTSNGVGSSTRVSYVPRQSFSTPGTDAWSTLRADATLYHELVHAAYDTYGTTDYSTVQAGPGVPAQDVGVAPSYEHQAVGLGAYANANVSENRYRWERSQMAGAVGARPDDLGLPFRGSFMWTPPQAAAPQPSQASGGSWFNG